MVSGSQNYQGKEFEQSLAGWQRTVLAMGGIVVIIAIVAGVAAFAVVVGLIYWQ